MFASTVTSKIDWISPMYFFIIVQLCLSPHYLSSSQLLNILLFSGWKNFSHRIRVSICVYNQGYVLLLSQRSFEGSCWYIHLHPVCLFGYSRRIFTSTSGYAWRSLSSTCLFVQSSIYPCLNRHIPVCDLISICRVLYGWTKNSNYYPLCTYAQMLT